MSDDGKWVVNILGGRSTFEISLVRSDYDHGRRSYGWPSKDQKIILFKRDSHASGMYSGGSTKISDAAWQGLRRLAETECAAMNDKSPARS
jgi:hypothetical protein